MELSAIVGRLLYGRAVALLALVERLLHCRGEVGAIASNRNEATKQWVEGHWGRDGDGRRCKERGSDIIVERLENLICKLTRMF